MGMVNEKTMARLLKVFELHKRGVDGEAENARTLLTRLLKENGLTMADLEDGHDAQKYSFPAVNQSEQRLIVQVILKVVTGWTGTYWQVKGSSKRKYEMTPAQHAEVSVMYSLYRADLKKTIERAFCAFIQANNIFEPSNDEEQEQPEYTPGEAAEIKLMLEMANQIAPTQVRKQIGAEA